MLNLRQARETWPNPIRVTPELKTKQIDIQISHARNVHAVGNAFQETDESGV